MPIDVEACKEVFGFDPTKAGGALTPAMVAYLADLEPERCLACRRPEFRCSCGTYIPPGAL